MGYEWRRGIRRVQRRRRDPAAARGHLGLPRCGRRPRRGHRDPRGLVARSGFRQHRGRGASGRDAGPAPGPGAPGLRPEQADSWSEEDLDDEQVGDVRSGRLVASDDADDRFVQDVGIDGAGASAEEAAMHVIDDRAGSSRVRTFLGLERHRARHGAACATRRRPACAGCGGPGRPGRWSSGLGTLGYLVLPVTDDRRAVRLSSRRSTRP